MAVCDCTPIKAYLCSEIFLAKEQKLVVKEKKHCSDNFKENSLTTSPAWEWAFHENKFFDSN